MQKLIRLMAVLLAPGLALVFFNTVLAGPPATSERANGLVVQTAHHLPRERSLLSQPITGLSIIQTSAALANLPTQFRANIDEGAQPIFYRWAFGDGATSPINQNPVISHTYAAPGSYTVVVTAFNIFGPATASLVVSVGEPVKTYLPLMLKEFTPPIPPADLACSLRLNPAQPSAGQAVVIEVDLQNIDDHGAADGFWVDLYLNPTLAPTPGNLFRWEDVCGPGCPGGVAWSISDAPLAPNITRTLVSIPNNFHPDGFDPDNSSWSGSLPAGTYNIYAYVDSINDLDGNNDGAVFESDETNNRCEILGLTVSTSRPLQVGGVGSGQLPRRARP